MNPVMDPNGKPSAMRVGVLAAVFTGCAMLLGITFGPGNVEMADEALWVLGLAFTGKAIQRMGEPTSPRDKKEA